MVTVVTMVPSGMMVRSISTFLVGVMLVRRDVACRAFKDAGDSWNSSYKESKALFREALSFPDRKAGMFGQQKQGLWAPRSHPQYSISSTVGGLGTEGQVKH